MCSGKPNSKLHGPILALMQGSYVAAFSGGHHSFGDASGIEFLSLLDVSLLQNS